MNTVISVRIDDNLKKSAKEVAESLGLSLSTLIAAYLRQVVATRKIELYASEPMTSQLENLIEQVEAEIRADKLSKKFNNVSDFLDDLKS